MPRKRKADATNGELEPSKKVVRNEEHEEGYLEPHRLGQTLDLSHAHPDEPLPSMERTNDWLLSSSPIERHVNRRPRISQDLLNVNFPRDEDGYIAKVKDAVPGRDISPYAAYLRSDGSPVPYNSRDYGPWAASTPSGGIDGEPDFEESFEPHEDQSDLGEENKGDYENLEEPGTEPSSIGSYEEDEEGVLEEDQQGYFEEDEEGVLEEDQQGYFEEDVQDNAEEVEDSRSSSALPPFTSLSPREVDDLVGGAPQLNRVMKASIVLQGVLALENDSTGRNGETPTATSKRMPLGSPFSESSRIPIPSGGIDGESRVEEASESNDDQPASNQENIEDYRELDGSGNDASSLEEDREDRQEAFEELNNDLSEESEAQTESSNRLSSNNPFLDFSEISWDHENAGPRRMLGRRPPPLPAPTSDSTGSSPIGLDRYSNKQPKDESANTPKDDNLMGSSVNLRGGLLERILNAGFYQYTRRVSAPGVEDSILLLNLDILGTVGNIPAPISRSTWTLWLAVHLYRTYTGQVLSDVSVFALYSSTSVIFLLKKYDRADIYHHSSYPPAVTNTFAKSTKTTSPTAST